MLSSFSSYRSLFWVQHEPSLLPVTDNLPSLVEESLADLRPIRDVLALEEHGGGLPVPVGLLWTITARCFLISGGRGWKDWRKDEKLHKFLLTLYIVNVAMCLASYFITIMLKSARIYIAIKITPLLDHLLLNLFSCPQLYGI